MISDWSRFEICQRRFLRLNFDENHSKQNTNLNRIFVIDFNITVCWICVRCFFPTWSQSSSNWSRFSVVWLEICSFVESTFVIEQISSCSSSKSWINNWWASSSLLSICSIDNWRIRAISSRTSLGWNGWPQMMSLWLLGFDLLRSILSNWLTKRWLNERKIKLEAEQDIRLSLHCLDTRNWVRWWIFD